MRKISAAFIIVSFLLLISSPYLSAQEAEITVSIEPAELQAGDTGILRARFTVPEGMYMALQEQFFFVDIPENGYMSLGDIEYPEGKDKNGLTVYRGEVTLTRPFTLSEDIPAGEHVIEVITGYQFCDEAGTCFLPQSREHEVTMTVSETGDNGRSDLLRILQFILFAFIGGIMLNIMPCVLPLLSVRALSLVNQSQQDKKKIFAGSMAYAGGIIVSFLVLATIVTVLKVSGELVGWGFQFQNVGFVIVLISIIFVFSLSMFDVFVISPPGTAAASKASGKGGYIGSFLTGVFAVLVATPCTAPFLGAALGFAFSQPPAVIYLIFIFVGLGLALPFILLGIWPRLIQKIPKPGNWMNIFKEVMGFFLLGTVIYLLTTLFKQISGPNFIRMIIFLGVLAFASWVYGRFAKPGTGRLRQWIVFFIVAVIVSLSAVFILRTEPEKGERNTALSAEEEEDFYISSDWEVFSPEKLEEYLRQGRPVFISFHAAWCTNCKVNRAAVLSKEDILRAFRDHNAALLHGDYTQRDETIAQWIRKFGKAGVPVYALYVPGKEDPIIFPELLSKNMIFSALERPALDQHS